MILVGILVGLVWFAKNVDELDALDKINRVGNFRLFSQKVGPDNVQQKLSLVSFIGYYYLKMIILLTIRLSAI